jgi:hypothetical protein
VAIGARNPNWTIPGLCSPLRTDLVALLAIGTTDATGAITHHMAGAATLVLRNSLGGAQLFAQAHSLDLASPFAIPVRNSAGYSVVLPMPQTNKVVGVARIYNNVGGTTATQGVFTNPPWNVGYGLVTEFQ